MNDDTTAYLRYELDKSHYLVIKFDKRFLITGIGYGKNEDELESDNQ